MSATCTLTRRVWIILLQLVFNIAVTVAAISMYGLTGIIFAGIIILAAEIQVRRKWGY